MVDIPMTQIITFTIKAIPPSLNSLYKTAYGRIYMTQEGKDFKREVEDYLLFRYKIKEKFKRPSTNNFSLMITYYLNNDNDLDNLQKALLDSFETLIYKDDQQITTLTIKKRYTADKPYINITVIEDDKPYDFKTLTQE